MKTDRTIEKFILSATLVLLLLGVLALPVLAEIDLGSFAGKVDTSVGTTPTDVALGDLDGDGKLDVAVSNNGSGNLSVLLNTSTPGAIAFSSTIVTLTVTAPRGIVIGDLDGDGKRDIAVANYSAGAGTTISVFTNTSTLGNLSFESAQTFAVGTGPIILAIGDLNGDGKLDLVTSNWGTNGAGTTLSVLRNTSASSILGFVLDATLTTNQGPVGVTIGNINGDALPDIVVANYGNNLGNGSTLSVLPNTTSGTPISFGAKVDSTTGGGPYDIALGDMDGDLDLDVAVTQYGTSGAGAMVSIFQNSGGTLAATATLTGTTGNGPYRIIVGDVDQDGKPEIATSNFQNGSGSTVSVLRNVSSSGTISFTTNVDFNTQNGPRGLAFGDIDAPSRRDLVVTNGGSASFSVLRNTTSAPTAVGLVSLTGEARAFNLFESVARFADHALGILGAVILVMIGWIVLRAKRR
ncbi:MAG: VCBS repeat-containing protein [Chloroflexi bacterium]|nr:VCBS repeat-containing protein [Chloroflexota bacterium]